MFDIGFGELLLIAVVALVVLGPERLPKAARFAGLWVRRARAQWYSVKAELERDLAAEELRRSFDDTREAMRGFEDSVRRTGSELERELGSVRDALDDRPAAGQGDDPAQPLPPPEPAGPHAQAVGPHDGYVAHGDPPQPPAPQEDAASSPSSTAAERDHGR